MPGGKAVCSTQPKVQGLELHATQLEVILLITQTMPICQPQYPTLWQRAP